VVQPSGKATRHQRRSLDTRKDLPVNGACLSFGSLKTEEKTERQCGQYAPTLGWTRNCLSISLSATLPAATRLSVDSSFVPRVDHTARTHRPHESFPTRMVRSLTIVAGSDTHLGEREGWPRFCWRV
jgi:hypothetical protein